MSHFIESLKPVKNIRNCRRAKQISLLVISLFIILISAYMALSQIIIENNVPYITTEFVEEVVLIDAFIENLEEIEGNPAGTRFEVTNSTDDNKTFEFISKEALFNGDYRFNIVVTDKVGNYLPPQYSYEDFEVNLTAEPIQLVNPKHGVSPDPIFNFVVNTSLESDCKWWSSNLDFEGLRAFDETGPGHIDHTYYDFNDPQDIELVREGLPATTIYVKCKEIVLQVIQPASFDLSIDSTNPVITDYRAKPSLVTVMPLNVNLSVITDEETICKYSNDSTVTTYDLMEGKFDGWNDKKREAYKINNIAQLSFVSNPTPADYNYTVACENLAGLISETEQIDFRVDPTIAFEITVTKPPILSSESSFKFNLTTTKPPTLGCWAGLFRGSTDITLSKTTNDLIYVSPLQTLSHGTYTYYFWCQSDGIAEAQHTFTIDQTTPQNLVIESPSPSCSLTQLDLNLTAEDPESGIIGYYYRLIHAGTPITDWEYVDSIEDTTDVTLSSLSLTKTLQYYFEAIAVNGLEINSSSEEESELVLVDPDHASCVGFTPPDITLVENDEGFGGLSVTFECVDEIACTTPYLYGLASSPESCTADIGLNDPFKTQTLFESQYICWEISDVSGNTAFGSQLITVGYDPCGNDFVDTGEECDLNQLVGQTCYSLGYLGGALACDDTCEFDTNGCLGSSANCGNCQIDVAEDCDDGNNIDNDGCSASCDYETDITGPACGPGLSLCIDGSCSLDCIATAGNFQCNGINGCEAGESCECADCNGDATTCSGSLECSISAGACCDLIGDSFCDYCSPCVDVDPDCGDCGDCKVDYGEQCDDGNVNENDGCDSTCQYESLSGPTCPETLTLCSDGTCSLNCGFTDTSVSCNGINGCEPGEGCECNDCNGNGDSCQGNLFCDVSVGACCDTTGSDGICDMCSPCFSVDPDCNYCGDDVVNQMGEDCDLSDYDGMTCEALGYDSGSLSCAEDCKFIKSGCLGAALVCGDGIVQQPNDASFEEECDDTDLDSTTCSGLDDFTGGSLGCEGSCVFDASGCTGGSFVCGNDFVDDGEECDGVDLDGMTCGAFGYDSGVLSCDASCIYDKSGCSGGTMVCGDSVIQTPNDASFDEECDGSELGGISCSGLDDFTGGSLGCDGSCVFDASGCTGGSFVCG
ncbi:hypothetical protein ACFL0W_06340, partial [Nanoarchaeota archaeon]